MFNNKGPGNIFGGAQNNSPFGQPPANNVFGANNNTAAGNVFGNRSIFVLKQIQSAIMPLLIIRELIIFLVRLISQIIHHLVKTIKTIILLQEIIPPIRVQEYLGKTTTLQLTLSFVKITLIKLIISPRILIMVFLGRIITLEAITCLMPAHQEQAFLEITLNLDRIMPILQSLAQIHRVNQIINQIRCLISQIIVFLRWLELGIIINHSYSKVCLQFIYYLQLLSFSRTI